MSALDDLSDAMQGVLDAIGAVAPDPGERIRVLLDLATAPGTGPAAVMARRSAVIALAEASSTYVPTSYDDAQAVTALVAAAIDAEVTAAGDAGDDASFGALLALRQAVVADLTARGGSLAPLATFQLPENLPALVVAGRLYGDATREDEVVRRVVPVHPLFMPVAMQLLAR